MEGQELKGNDTEDALQTVHSMWQLDGLVGVLTHVRVILATKDDGPTLMEIEMQARLSVCATVIIPYTERRSRCVFPCRQVCQMCNIFLPIWL